MKKRPSNENKNFYLEHFLDDNHDQHVTKAAQYENCTQ